MSNQENNSTKIQMLDYQKPALRSGQYKIQVKQTVKGSNIDGAFENKMDVIVSGDRFTLAPDAVHACFPPEGSLGRHTDVLPHISLKKGTLPWERSAYDNDDDDPWMALLLFGEMELLEKKVTEKTLTAKELSDYPPLEAGQMKDDKVKVIDVEKALLEQILPTGDELKLLAHVRRRTDGNGSATDLAFVAANRLPRPGSESTLHLVSLEGRYNDDRKFNYGDTEEAGFIRLVSLKKWGFACLEDTGKNFEELVEAISTGMLTLPKSNTQDSPEKSELHRYLQAGYVPLPHTLRQCDQTYSWYHGPLSPCAVGATFTDDSKLPKFADGLVRYHEDIGMFDVSYAAAFEIGRALALADMQFSANIYQWKQQYNEAVLVYLEQLNTQKLTGGETAQSTFIDNNSSSTLEGAIEKWLKKLQKLVDVPFSYLVPDGRLLPSESIRFFQLDRHWLESLLYGAFTIGGTVRTVDNPPKDVKTELLKKFYTLDETISGCIVRSQLVAGYPDLQVDAYPNSKLEKGDELKEIRIERLGVDVLLCLFEGEIATVDLYLKPEGLHFGLGVKEEGGHINSLNKRLSIYGENSDDKPSKIEINQPADESWLRGPSARVLHITNLANDIQKNLKDNNKGNNKIYDEISPAVFAMQMLKGSDRGRFKATSGSAEDSVTD